MNIKLIPMSDEEYKFWSQRSTKGYAEDKMRANQLTKAEADKIAKDDFSRLLPDGKSSKNNFLFSAMDDQNRLLGFIWFSIRGADDNKRAYLCDVIIEPEFRGKGYGKKIMQALEEEVKKIGLKRIDLHVFGFNKTAINLYESLDYQVTDLVMTKNLY